MLTKINLTDIKAGPDDGLAEGEFLGYASVFGNVDSYGDVVVKGAFTKDLARWKASGYALPCLFGHNMQDPDFNIGHVLEASEDEKGLRVHVKLDLEMPKAKATYRLLKGKRINQMSFAYDIIEGGPVVRKAAPDDEEGEQVYELRELKIYEVSIVPVGANQETEILDVKAIRRMAERAALKAGRTLSAKNEQTLRGAYEAIGAVLSTLDGEQPNDESKATGPDSTRQGAQGEQPREEDLPQPSVDLSALELLDLELASS